MTESDLIDYKPGESNLVLTMPHSAIDIPEGVNHLLNIAEHTRKTLRAGVDLCVPFVTGFHEYESAARVSSRVPRAVFDVNRLLVQADRFAVEGGSSELDAHGMIWRASVAGSEDDIRDILQRPYTRDEFKDLKKKIYEPYVQAVQSAMVQARGSHGIAIQFDLHSMPGVDFSHVKSGTYRGAYLLHGERERGTLADGKYPDILLLGSCLRTSTKLIRNMMMTTFRDHGLLVDTMEIRPQASKSANEVNYANPENQRYSLGIEIVGHNFEPKRAQGSLLYCAEKQDKFRSAFKDVFSTLEGISSH